MASGEWGPHGSFFHYFPLQERGICKVINTSHVFCSSGLLPLETRTPWRLKKENSASGRAIGSRGRNRGGKRRKGSGEREERGLREKEEGRAERDGEEGGVTRMSAFISVSPAVRQRWIFWASC